ncbi:MAG: hypothetical protein LBU88_02905 [Treponema sp.]|jgi:hypothetical protein|nr:hypothetical protein [Treponema sp.]
MFVNIQYPIIDFRDFISNEDSKMFYNRVLDKIPNSYLRSFGEKTEKINKQGSPVEVRTYVNACRAMRYGIDLSTFSFNAVNTKISLKSKNRLFFTDKAVSYFSIGVNLTGKKTTGKKATRIILSNINAFFNTILSIEMKIPVGKNKREKGEKTEVVKTSLKEAGRYLSSLYFFATTHKEYLPFIKATDNPNLPCTPLIIFEYDKIEKIPYWCKKIENINGLCVHYGSMKIEKRIFFLWMIKRDKLKKDKIDNLHTCISRMHRNIEGLRKAGEWLDRSSSRKDLNFERIRQFILEKIKYLTMEKSRGYNIKKLLSSVYGININKNSVEYQNLEKALNRNIKQSNEKINERLILDISRNINDIMKGESTKPESPYIKKIKENIILILTASFALFFIVMAILVLHKFLPSEHFSDATKILASIMGTIFSGGVGGLTGKLIKDSKILERKPREKNSKKDEFE